MIYSKHPAKGPVALGTTIRLPGQHARQPPPPAARDAEADPEDPESAERVALCRRWPPICGPEATETSDLAVCGVSRLDVLLLHRRSALGALLFGSGFLLGFALASVV
jgi:hypothetical protein